MLPPANKNSKSQTDPPLEPTQVVPPNDSTSALVQILDEYFADLQAGKNPDRAQLLAAHPELAPELERCLSGLEFIQSASIGNESAPKQLGDFRIVREVGRGGMGVVYEAEQISLRRKVALKVLRFAAVADSEAMQRFQREAETVAGLHHTNIVPIFAIGADEGVHYYAMQFIEGRSLAELISKEPEEQISPADIANWGLQAAEALSHAHQRGVVHRDVKPSNLIQDDDGRIWLTDFGLAKRTDDVTLSVAGALLGTPRYMSPEQASALSKPVDHRTDIYSLGATLYELATGQPIFNAQSAHGIITQILNEEPPRPRTIKPDLPRDLETIILKCLSKDVRQRYQSARELADDLRAFAEERPIKARRASLLQTSLRWVRKHRRGVSVALATAAATLLLSIGISFGWRQYQWAHMGHVVFQTEQAQVEAELFDAEGTLVVPSFSLPTRQPVSLPEGQYLAQVSAPGRLSQTFEVELTAQGPREDTFNLRLPERDLIAPIDVDTQAVLKLVELDGRTNLIRAAVEDGKRQMWRIDGTTGQPVWNISLQSSDNSDLFVREGESQDWNRVLEFDTEIPPEICSPAPDLDGDGTGDLVWSSARTTTLLAVSGQSGAVLWWFQGFVDPALSPRQGDSVLGRTVGAPVVTQIDDDGVPDFVALFVEGKDRKWIEAVSGKNGTSLWRRDLDSQWFRSPRWSSAVQLFAPELVEVEGQHVIALAAGTRFVVLNVQSGEPFSIEEFETPVIQQPRFGYLNDDSSADVVLLLDGEEWFPRLVALSIKDRRKVWEQQISARFEPYTEPAGDIAWPLVVDLDHDGHHEVVVPAYREREFQPGSRRKFRCSELEVLNGRDGSLRWRRELRRESDTSLLDQPDRFVVGPDLNEDGFDELFAASTTHRFSGTDSNGTVLYLDALSGEDGQSLWWWSRSLNHWDDKVGELSWCTPGPDGWPLLVVPVIGWNRQPERLHLLAGVSGKELHQIPGAYQARGADFDGDGREELCYWTGSQFDIRRGTGEFHAVHNPASVRWTRLLQAERGFLPAGDLDGDGVDDVVLPGESLQAISGASGWTLWRKSRFSTVVCVPLVAPQGDLDGDGVGDLLVANLYGVTFSSPMSPLQAVSGKTGATLWSADIQTQSFGKTRLLAQRDLDQDGSGEVIFVADWDATSTVDTLPPDRSLQLWLTVLDGKTGQVKWKHPLSRKLDRTEEWYFELCTGDLNGDGTLDLILPAIDESSEPRWQLQAVSGIDGETLWEFSLAENQGEFADLQRQAPWPIVGDLNGDGKLEVVVTDYWSVGQTDGQPVHLEAAVISIDSETGEQEWSWNWDLGGLYLDHRPAVILTDLDGNAGSSVCLRTSYRDEAESVLLDAKGEVVERVQGGERFDELAGPVMAAKWRGRKSGQPYDQSITLQDRRENGQPLRVFRGDTGPDSLICEVQLPDAAVERQLIRQPYIPPQKPDPRLARPLPWNFPARNHSPLPLSFLGDVAIAMLATGVISLIVLIVPVLLIRWALRWHSRKLWSLAAIYLVGLIAFGIFARGGAPDTPWYSMLMPALGGAVVGIPDVTILVLVGSALMRGRWKRVGEICLGILGLGVLAAVLLLWYDQSYRVPGDYYTTSGWFWAFIAGAYLTGAAAFVFLAGRSAIGFLKRHFSKTTARVTT